MTTDAPALAPARPPSRARRIATWLHARPRTQLRLLLAVPLFWLVVVYLGSLAILLLNAFWTTDSFTGKVNPFDWSLAAFEEIIGERGLPHDRHPDGGHRPPGDRDRRDPRVPDRLLHGPHRQPAGQAACWWWRCSCRCGRRTWSRSSPGASIFQGNGLLSWFLAPFGLAGPGTDELANSWIVFSYLWLPYMILPIYAGLERVPSSLLEASADLGARARTTFRRVVLPLCSPPWWPGRSSPSR